MTQGSGHHWPKLGLEAQDWPEQELKHFISLHQSQSLQRKCYYLLIFRLEFQGLMYQAMSKSIPYTMGLTLPSTYLRIHFLRVLGPPTLTTSGCLSLTAGPSMWCHPMYILVMHSSPLTSLVTDSWLELITPWLRMLHQNVMIIHRKLVLLAIGPVTYNWYQ